MDKLTFIIADDHVLMRNGIVQLLHECSASAHIYEASNYPEALALASAHPDCHLALIDLGMPGMDAFEALELLARNTPTIPVVVLSASENVEDMRRVLASGAVGYIPKSESAAVILNALRLVLAGGVYVPPALVDAGPLKTRAPTASPSRALSPRQLEVLALVIEGQHNKQIAKALGLSEATVKTHVATIYRILNVTNRTQAARVAEQQGLPLNRVHHPR